MFRRHLAALSTERGVNSPSMLESACRRLRGEVAESARQRKDL
jgi:hypothetical protein